MEEDCIDQVCGCVADFIPLERKTANMLILLDRSGTMLDDSRWIQAQNAIDTITQSHQDEIRFGLMFFPRGVGVSDCSTGDPQVEPALGNRMAILDAVDVTPGEYDGTPMAHSLLRIRREQYLSDPAFAQHIVLVTDGNPTCLWDDPAYKIDDSNLVAELRNIVLSEVQKLRDGVTIPEGGAAPGVKTYAVGMGNSYDSAFLDQVAAAGGTGLTTAFDADSLPALEDALSTIAQKVIACEYDLGDTIISDGTSVSVRIGDNSVEEDPSSGYTIDTVGGKLTFHGAACDSLQDSPNDAVKIHIGCQITVD